MDDNFIELKDVQSSIDDESIYYLYSYCSKKKTEELDNGIISYGSFICLKNYHAMDRCSDCGYSGKCTIYEFYDRSTGYNNKRFRFVNAFVNAVNKNLPLTGEWIILSVPGSQSSEKNNNPCNNIAFCYMKKDRKSNINFDTNIRDLLIREHTVVKNHLSDPSARRSYPDNKNSLKITNKKAILNKNILLLDDITTQGTTLIATRDFLLDNGAKRVVMLSFGKTL